MGTQHCPVSPSAPPKICNNWFLFVGGIKEGVKEGTDGTSWKRKFEAGTGRNSRVRNGTGGLQHYHLNGPGQTVLTAGIRVPDEGIGTHPSSTDSIEYRCMFTFRHLRRNPVPTFGRNPVSTFGRLPTFAFAAFRHTPSPPSGIHIRPYDNQRR